jgi:hypothetical protein
MSAENEPPDPELIELADSFLGATLDPASEAAFEARLRTDVQARAALIEALTLRAMLAMACSETEAAVPSTSCEAIRGILPAYHERRLDPAGTAQVARHLPACPVCGGFYEALRRHLPRRRTPLRRAAALALGLILVAGAGFGASRLLGTAGGPSAPPAREAEARNLLRPRLAAEHDALLLSKLGKGTLEADSEPLEAAIGLVRDHDPGYFDRVLSAPRVRETLRELGFPEPLRDVPREARLLAGFVCRPDLDDERRAGVILAIGRLLGERARPWLYRLAETTDSRALLEGAVLAMQGGDPSSLDPSHLRRIYDRTRVLSATRGALSLLEQLVIRERGDALLLLEAALAVPPDDPLQARRGALIILAFNHARQAPWYPRVAREIEGLVERPSEARDPGTAAFVLEHLLRRTGELRYRRALIELVPWLESNNLRTVVISLAMAPALDEQGFWEALRRHADPLVGGCAKDALTRLQD